MLEPSIQIQRVFVRGVSLQMPDVFALLVNPGELTIEFGISAATGGVADQLHQVTVRGTVTGKVRDKTLYVLEMDQTGMYLVDGVPDEAVQQFLAVQAPTMLTPYLRANIADALTRANMPAFHIPDVDWATQPSKAAIG